jgi:hypothetical protein
METEKNLPTQAEYAASMDAVFEMITSMGMTYWIEGFDMETDRKRTTLTNMMNWFASPENEEYEKAAVIRDVLQLI